MRRRALLAGLAGACTGLAGCNLTAEQPETLTPAPVPTDTATPTDEPADDSAGRPVGPDEFASVIDLETVSRTYALFPTRFQTDDRATVALWFAGTATEAHPAIVRGFLLNAGDDEKIFHLAGIPAVGRTYSQLPVGSDHGTRLHFAPTENNDLAEIVPTFARTTEGHWYVEKLASWMPDSYQLDAGEWVFLEYALVGEPGMPGRPTGTYEFHGGHTVRVAVWDTAAPGPTVDSQFEGVSVPRLRSDHATSWFHDADADSAVYVRPSTERIELDGTAEFEAVNHSHESLGCGHWDLYKLVGGEWFHIRSEANTAECRLLHPGGRRTLTLRAFNGETVPCSERCGLSITQGFLGGGRYGVVVGWGHPADASGALVELLGETIEIVPTADVEIERVGSTAYVQSDRFGDDEGPPDATLVLERADAATERLIAEQVMAPAGPATSSSGLRNALAAMTEDVDRVVVRTDELAVQGAVGHEGRSRTFRFRGEEYAVEKQVGT